MKKLCALLLSVTIVFTAFMAMPQKKISIKQVIEKQTVYADSSSETIYQLWDFERGITGWNKYVDSKIDVTPEAGFIESNALAISCNFSSSTAYDWDTAPMFTSPGIPTEVGEATYIAMDVYTTANFTVGGINLTPIIQSPQHNYWFMTGGVNISSSEGTAVGNFKKYTISVPLVDASGAALAATDVVNYIVVTPTGVNTNYADKLYFDNIRLIGYSEPVKKELSISQVSVKNSWGLVKDEEIQVSCTAMGGEAPYRYTYYVLKDGKVHYKSSLRQSNPIISFTLSEAGEYTMLVYCMDTGSERTMCKKQFTITVYNDSSEIPQSDKLIALTFDDGPDANAGVLLDILNEKNVKATFYVWHEYAQYNTALLKRTYDEGHQVGNHTYNHTYLTQLLKEEAIAEIEKNNDFIESVIGIRPDTYRPPYLDYNSTVLSYFPTMAAIGCSVDSVDWSGISKEQIIQNVVSKAADGDIVLMHEPQANTRAAIGEIIDQLREKGFEFVTVDELFARKGVTKKGATYYSYVR